MKQRLSLDNFRSVTLVDFEFCAPPGEMPKPICVVALELKTGRLVRGPVSEFQEAPYGVGKDDLVVAFYASAEISCHLALGWAVPARILDLYCEFRQLTNHGSTREPASLLHALAHFRLDSIGASEKEGMRALAIRGGPFTAQELHDLLEYCESDVQALAKLLPAMLPHFDLGLALNRGRYMGAIAVVEHNGIPIDAARFELFKAKWDVIQLELVARVNSEFDVYDGKAFRQKKFQEYLNAKGTRWPRLPSGKLNLSDEAFRSMAIANPDIARLREVRAILSKMKLSSLAVGSDQRNRCLLSAFASKTGRNQPSNSKFAFGLASWMRNLIKPEPGYALAYVDWEQQEFGTGAALSGDVAMKHAYASGDPYLTFAKQAGAIPRDATKKSHAVERERFKMAALGVQYGMGPQSLALQLGQSMSFARDLLGIHKRTYPRFWQWQEGIVSGARIKGTISTVYGWQMKVSRSTGSRTIANFPIQGNGAEMLRIAIFLAVERGIKVCAPVHDALLIEAPEELINEAVAATQACMREASRYVLKDFELRADAKIIRYPDRYSDPRGQEIWAQVNQIVGAVA